MRVVRRWALQLVQFLAILVPRPDEIAALPTLD
jgi:hypothetical protein